jgi:hypothetical protein
MEPAPTACTLAAAPPDSVRITISIAMLVETAERMANRTNKIKDAM